MNKLIVLLDETAVILEQKMRVDMLMQQADNKLIAGLIFIAIGLTIALVLLFLSSGSGSNDFSRSNSSDSFDSFSSKKSEGSSSSLPSNTDITSELNSNLNSDSIVTNNSVSFITEDSVIQTQVEVLQPLQSNLMETLDRARDQLLPTLSNWVDSSKNQISFFDESNTVRVGSSLKDWLLTLNTSFERIENGDMSIDVLQNVFSTVNSINDILPGFLHQLDRFMSKANLNDRPFSEISLKDHEFILNSRDVAKELLQKLLDNEALLTQISPGSIVFPDWFPGLVCFFSMLNVACSKELESLPKHIRKIFDQITNHFKSENVDCLKLKDYLLQKLYHCYKNMTSVMDNTTEHTSSVNYLYTARVEKDIQTIPDLLTKLIEHNECLKVDPKYIFLFLG